MSSSKFLASDVMAYLSKAGSPESDTVERWQRLTLGRVGGIEGMVVTHT